MAALCDVPQRAEWRKAERPELGRLPETVFALGGRGI